jgi:hypothetical protein
MATQLSNAGSEIAVGDLGSRSAVHVLNRLGYGPRPGDIDRVLKKGIDRYVEEQLDPRPDPALDARLAALPYTRWTMAEAWDHNLKDIAAFRSLRPDESYVPYIFTLNTQTRTAQLVRAVHSQNQLLERMTWFWFNHFNVNLLDDYVRYSAHDYERQLRRHALGKFRDLLLASAHHPAMMSYLDNYLSTVSRYDRNGRLVSGLNENYGRELLELHTLGVDAGYTQEHVYNAAVLLTGWGFNQAAGTFVFSAANHDSRATDVFGYSVPAGLMQEGGEGLLLHLSRHPKTAEFISGKLIRCFVSDEAPPALVQRCTETFLATDGDIREVLRVVFGSDEFWGQALGLGRYKDPFQYVAGVLRALDAEVTDGRRVAGSLNTMGQPQYGCIPPTGWSDLSREWVNPSAHLQRINFTLDLVSERRLSDGTPFFEGIDFDVRRLVQGHGGRANQPSSVAAVFNRQIFANGLSSTTVDAVRGVPGGTVPLGNRIAGLILTGPEAQRS